MSFYTVLVFMGIVSTDPHVSLEPEFMAFHYAMDDNGRNACDELRKEFNAALARLHYETGRFECQDMSGEKMEWLRRKPY
jgi:hypothetical protein